MTQITIPALVVNGHLHHEKSLADLEGQHVTLTVVPENAVNGKGPTAAKPDESAEFDPEPPTWLEVEHDLYFPMTVPERLLEIKSLIVERGAPSIILPEELPDE